MTGYIPTLEPVSYTHLDVYKRQTEVSIIILESQSGIPTQANTENNAMTAISQTLSTSTFLRFIMPNTARIIPSGNRSTKRDASTIFVVTESTA